MTDRSGADFTLDLTIDEAVPLPSGVSDQLLHDLIVHALRAEGATGSWDIGIQTTSDAGIQAMHRGFMGLDSPTDIMTFPYESDGSPGDPAMEQGGDIVISVDTARTNALEAGWATADELKFLVLHGVLHLLGWDDATNEDRASMLARQSTLLMSWRAITRP